MAEREHTAVGHEAVDLTRCPRCDCDLVYPLDWAPAGMLGWSIALRCPECEWRSAGTYPQKVADRFDSSLESSTQSLLDDLSLLARANMEDQIVRFADALERNLILPEDF